MDVSNSAHKRYTTLLYSKCQTFQMAATASACEGFLPRGFLIFFSGNEAKFRIYYSDNERYTMNESSI
ncbi:hypothetical protein DERF_012090 [Dermatophagoides farinae]|uniref:Uncharacterized protein n=1 Tax=Dermatophagoides farinae TaxID=6954 RepID=A0A922KWR8_DERFA|nr:hypothetical protein DERF_012090 [Dermatophagoides farinae]